MKKISGLIFLFLGVIVLSGCGSQSTGVTSTGSSAKYPALYTAEKLPQYADAKVSQVIKDGPTLKDGNLFILESAKDVKTIATYFDAEMTKLGWSEISPNDPTETSYATQFNGPDKKYLQLTVSQITAGKQTISINFMQQ